MANKRLKLNAYVVPEIKQYVVDESEKMGMSQGAFISYVLSEYMQGNLNRKFDYQLTINDLVRIINNLKK